MYKSLLHSWTVFKGCWGHNNAEDREKNQGQHGMQGVRRAKSYCINALNFNIMKGHCNRCVCIDM